MKPAGPGGKGEAAAASPATIAFGISAAVSSAADRGAESRASSAKGLSSAVAYGSTSSLAGSNQSPSAGAYRPSARSP